MKVSVVKKAAIAHALSKLLDTDEYNMVMANLEDKQGPDSWFCGLHQRRYSIGETCPWCLSNEVRTAPPGFPLVGNTTPTGKELVASKDSLGGIAPG